LCAVSRAVSRVCSSNRRVELQSAEKVDALCTKFDLNHVQKAEKVDACGERKPTTEGLKM
ncbi:hypothetical protein CG394_08120, partial [Gardnerella vaginalis]